MSDAKDEPRILSSKNGLISENIDNFAGEPDGLERLWVPHRGTYINGENKPKDSSESQCPFCTAPKRTDEEALIIARGKECFALLNLYPYNSGHVLVCTYRHVSLYTELTESERIETGEMTARAMKVLSAAMHPHGFNLGMNQGEVAGAGIAAHIHQHIVPRWAGDANFFPIVAHVKAVPALLSTTQRQLSTLWQEMYPDAL